MPLYSPQTLAEWTTGTWSGPPPVDGIEGFSHDTRRLEPGDCFVALETGRRDGHAFLENARLAGAAAALVSTPRPEVDLPQLVTNDAKLAFQTIALRCRYAFPGTVVGVTGSCGKTSTKDLIAHLLGSRCLKTEKNLNNTLGVPLTLTKLDPARHAYAVVEAGINEPGEMSVLAGMIAPDIACVTMIGPAHLEKLGSLENIAREKAELARLAAPGASLVCANSCLGYDAFRHFPGEIFAVCPACEERPALDYTEYRCCMKFFREEDGSTRVQVYSAPLAGQFRVRASLTAGMVSNAVMAAVTAVLCGAKWDDVRERFLDWRPAADRGALYHRGKCFYYVDCYNANPASMRDALETFRTLAPPDKPRLYVLGGMKELGAHAEALHRQTGAELPLRPQDRALLIGAEAKAYAEGLLAAGAHADQVETAPDAESAGGLVPDFEGAVFLKGSRAYALETLLPEGLLEGKEAATC